MLVTHHFATLLYYFRQILSTSRTVSAFAPCAVRLARFLISHFDDVTAFFVQEPRLMTNRARLLAIMTCDLWFLPHVVWCLSCFIGNVVVSFACVSNVVTNVFHPVNSV